MGQKLILQALGEGLKLAVELVVEKYRPVHGEHYGCKDIWRRDHMQTTSSARIQFKFEHLLQQSPFAGIEVIHFVGRGTRTWTLSLQLRAIVTIAVTIPLCPLKYTARCRPFA